MYNQWNIKLETNLTQNKSTCCGCLSSDRILQKLGEFSQLFTKITEVVDDRQDILLCWECVAVLRKVNTLRKNVAAAQRISGYYYDSQNPPQTLSKLTTKQLRNHEVKPHTETETKPSVEGMQPSIDGTQPSIEGTQPSIEGTLPSIEIRVKQETEDECGEEIFKDGCSIDYGIELDNIDDIKQELQEINTNKKTVKKRAQEIKYKEILVPKQKCTIVRREIRHNEINYWLENERNSPYYYMAKFKCDSCAIVLKSRNRKTHFNLFHNQNMYPDSHKCDICQCFFSEKSTLSSHIKEHYYIYTCTTCEVTCKSMQTMRNHVRVKANGKIYQCVECPGRFSIKRLFFRHYNEAHRHFICDYCSCLYKSKRMLIKHIATNHYSPKCDICNITFKKYRTQNEHMKRLHVYAPTEATYCAPCDKQFPNDAQFRYHISTSVAHSHERRSSIKKNEKVQCPKCPNLYHRRYGMMNHFRLVHLKRTNYYCNICEKYFLNSTRLKDHKRDKHEGYVPVKDKLCSICGRGFSTNRILTNHIRTHTGERPFHCTDCDSKFTQKVALDSHIKFIHKKLRRSAVHVGTR